MGEAETDDSGLAPEEDARYEESEDKAASVDPAVEGALDAAEHGRLDELAQLLDKIHVDATGDDGDTPLHMAALYGQLGAVEECLRRQANVNARDEDRSTPLHDAVAGGYLEIAKLLVGAKADVDAADEDGDTPLHNASKGGHLECVELLLTQKANPGACNEAGQTPIDLAESDEVRRVLAE